MNDNTLMYFVLFLATINLGIAIHRLILSVKSGPSENDASLDTARRDGAIKALAELKGK